MTTETTTTTDAPAHHCCACGTPCDDSIDRLPQTLLYRDVINSRPLLTAADEHYNCYWCPRCNLLDRITNTRQAIEGLEYQLAHSTGNESYDATTRAYLHGMRQQMRGYLDRFARVMGLAE